MERLKALHTQPDEDRRHEFTFQYGEIKSQHRSFYRRPTVSFTFQYGEIKSGPQGTIA